MSQHRHRQLQLQPGNGPSVDSNARSTPTPATTPTPTPTATRSTVSKLHSLICFIVYFLLLSTPTRTDATPAAAAAAASSRRQLQPQSHGAARPATLEGGSADEKTPYSLEPPIEGYALSGLVLVSGIDGSLTALDRATGSTMWTIAAQSEPALGGGAGGGGGRPAAPSSDLDAALMPLVSTEYGKRHTSLAAILAGPVEDDDEGFADHLLDGLPPRTRHLLKNAGMYIVEPGSSGRLYLLSAALDGDAFHPDAETGTGRSGQEGKARLQRLPLTLPELVALSPFSFPGDKARVFTGSKKTTLLRIDPLTGVLDRSWHADGSESTGYIHREAETEDDSKWAYLARTDYTLSVSLPRRPHLSQTLHYSTYSPQSSDADLASRWLQAYSDASIHSVSYPSVVGDGMLITPIGLDRDGRGHARVSGYSVNASGSLDHFWTRETQSQVVDVFDLLVPSDPAGSGSDVHFHPVIVPHPPFALSDLTGSDSPRSDADREDEGAADGEDTLLTFSPQTGSLYALSSQRFPGVVREVNVALAGLDDGERQSRALVPGNSAPSHHPHQCSTFGCWLGRYQVEHHDHSHKVPGLLRPSPPRLGIGSGSPSPNPPPPLGLPDRAANPDAEGRGQVSKPAPTEEPPPVPQGPKVSDYLSLPSRKVLFTQFLALALIAGIAALARKGIQVRRRLEQEHSESMVKQLGLRWDASSQQKGMPNGPAQPASLLDGQGAGAVSETSGQGQATQNGQDATAQKSDTTRANGHARTDSAATIDASRPVLGSEQADDPLRDQEQEPSTPKKKKKRRGKRAGAVVKARERAMNAAAGENGGGNGDEDSGSDDEASVKASMPQPQSKGTAFSALNDGWIETGPTSKSAEAQLVALAAKGTGTQQGKGKGGKASALEISDEVLGYGSSGTVVFKGRFQSRLVAVKRLLVDFVHLASQEISLLESADDHPNVIRYFYKEQTGNFLFIALELCPASLADIVERPDEWQELAVKLEPKKAVSQIASGLRHLHGLSIVHRDIKPQNILVSYTNPHHPSASSLKMMLSDFGLSKRLDSVAQSSFSQTMHHPGGTAGWRAPEILRGDVSLEDGASGSSSLSSLNAAKMASNGPGRKEKTRLTRAVDIFALGCLTYYLLTSGDHPFGARYEREVNIMRNQSDISRLAAFGEEGFEASHLVDSMIQPDPSLRPRAIQVLSHPYFWDAGKRLAFLQDVSDRIEVIDREKDKDKDKDKDKAQGASVGASTGAGAGAGGGANAAGEDPLESEFIRHLEERAKEVTGGGDWTKKVEKAFMDDLGKWRKYSGGSVRDLLRALRNKKHHYQDMPPALRRSMGALPDGFLAYFTRRFPKLFLHVYAVVAQENFIRTDTTFRDYFAQAEDD